MQAWLPPFALLMLSRVLEGASHLAVVVAAPILIAASCAPAHRSIAMGLWSTFVGVAFAITAAVGGPLLRGLGMGGYLLTHAAGMALMGALAWRALRHDRPDTDTATVAWPRLRTLGRQHMAVYTAFDTALPGLIFLCYTGMAVALLTLVPTWAGADRVWLAVLLPLLVIGGNFGAGWLVQHWLALRPAPDGSPDAALGHDRDGAAGHGVRRVRHVARSLGCDPPPQAQALTRHRAHRAEAAPAGDARPDVRARRFARPAAGRRSPASAHRAAHPRNCRFATDRPPTAACRRWPRP